DSQPSGTSAGEQHLLQFLAAQRARRLATAPAVKRGRATVSGKVESHRQVGGAYVLGEGSYGDVVDTGSGDGAHRLERDVAGGFQLDRLRAGAGERHGLCQGGVVEVVEQDDVGR